jgi:uncharacterized protein (TIGR00255 family)
MTGFARDRAQHGDSGWTWEVRSVNGRGLDVRCKLPPGYDGLDARVRAAAPKRFKRGNLSVSLRLDRGQQATHFQVNKPLLDELLAIGEGLAGAGRAEKPRLDALLAVRGVVEPLEDDGEADADAREAAMAKSLEAALDSLAEMRRTEGARLADVLAEHLDEIERLSKAAASCAAAQPDAIRERLKTQLAMLLEASPPLSEERLAQEVALLAGKADVREEIDRLNAHVVAARDLVAGGGAVGRRLDFLCQEFNREANTLCSKAQDVELTRIGLDLKAAIDQLREQVQNVE